MAASGSRRDDLRAFATFFRSYDHLVEFGLRDFLPFVRNHAADGVVAHSADRRLRSVPGKLWVARDPRPPTLALRPARFRTIPGGDRVLIGSRGSSVVVARGTLLEVWEVISGTLRTSLRVDPIDGDPTTTGLALSADEATAVTVGKDARLRVWDLAAGACRASWLLPSGWATEVALSADGRIAVTLSRYETHVWEVPTGHGRELPVRTGLDQCPTSVSLSADGRLALLALHEPEASPSSSRVTLWEVSSARLLGVLLEGPVVAAVSMTADARLAVTADWERNTLRLWDLSSTRCLGELHGHTDAVTAVATTPDGRLAVSASRDGTVRVWDLAIGACVRTMPVHDGGVDRLSITADGSLAVTQGRDRSAKVRETPVWDLAGGRDRPQMERHECPVTAVALSRDGRRAVSLARPVILKGQRRPLVDEHPVRVWDTGTGACVDRRAAGGSESFAVSFSEAGEPIVAEAPAAAVPTNSGLEHGIVVEPAAGRRNDPTLSLKDPGTNRTLATYCADSRVTAVSPLLPDGGFACGTRNGEVHFLRLVRNS